MSSKENPIRKIFDLRPATKHIEGAKNILGRCLIEKSPQSAQIDFKEAFTIIGEQVAYVMGLFISSVKSNLALLAVPVYLQSMHFYYVHEDDSYIGKL